MGNNDTVSRNRTAILQALVKASDSETVMLKDFSANAERLLQAMPEMACLGEAMKVPQNS